MSRKEGETVTIPASKRKGGYKYLQNMNKKTPLLREHYNSENKLVFHDFGGEQHAHFDALYDNRSNLFGGDEEGAVYIASTRLIKDQVFCCLWGRGKFSHIRGYQALPLEACDFDPESDPFLEQRPYTFRIRQYRSGCVGEAFKTFKVAGAILKVDYTWIWGRPGSTTITINPEPYIPDGNLKWALARKYASTIGAVAVPYYHWSPEVDHKPVDIGFAFNGEEWLKFGTTGEWASTRAPFYEFASKELYKLRNRKIKTQPSRQENWANNNYGLDD